MKDVAKRASVSVTTVSHVLNKTRYVDRKLVRRVEDAFRSLGYQPNALARGLRRQETRLLGMVVPDNRNLYFAELARSVEDACFERGYNVILCNSDEDPGKESAYLSLLAEKRVDGVFVASGSNRSGVQALLQHKIPVVALDRELKGMTCDSIIVDNRDGGRQATMHLIGGNHRRIGRISGPKNLTSAKERLQGYRDALAEAGLPVDLALIQMGNFHVEGLNTTLEAMAQGVPLVAIPVTNDQPGVAARIAPIKKTGTFVPSKQLTVPGLTLQIDDVPLSSNNPNALRWRYTFHLSSLMAFSMRRSRVSLVFAPSIA